MDEATYWKVKAAILEAAHEQTKAQAVIQRAWAKAYATAKANGVEEAPGYRWDDGALTVTPVRPDAPH